MKKIAFVFPGQGSQVVGMGRNLAEKDPKVAAIFEKADHALQESLSQLIFEGPQEQLTKTMNAQPALLTTSIAYLEKIKEHNIVPDYVAGHSLGEYTALVAGGAISFQDGVRIVRKRGEFMEEAVPQGQGTMAAILGINRELLSEIVDEVTEQGASVQLANINCPGQIVISGVKQGVERACERAKENGAKRAIPLEVSGPFHSRLMKPASSKLEDLFHTYTIQDTQIPVISNVTANPVINADEMKKLLVQQLYSPVLWEDSVRKMIELGVTVFVEIGPGKVLSGLIRKIDRSVKTISIFDEVSLLQAIDELKGDTL